MTPKHIVNALLCILPLLAGGVRAQDAPHIQLVPQRSNSVPAQPGGTVTGHVYCTDTQRPARFADVELLQSSDSISKGQTSTRGPSYQATGRARTALDGSFTITNVAPGDYYVVGTMTGYISPAAVSRMTQQPITGATFTHVDANHSADVMVSMDRGAVVAGRVTYDDGSPVPGVSVRLRPITSSSAPTDMRFGGGFGGLITFGNDMGFAQTDDRGAFRLTGLPPGRYSLMATVETETTGQASSRFGRGGFRGPPPVLNVYAPATMHKADAQVIEIHGGETSDGVDIHVALNGLHTMQGSIESKADGHMLNAGYASLADASDNTTVRNTSVDPDGTFRMEYLPAGTYTLTVSGMDRPPDTGRGSDRGGTSVRYAAVTQTVTMTDSDITMDPVQATVTPSSTGSTTASH